MIFNEELAGGRERVTTEEVRVGPTARRLERDKVMQVRGLRGSENFVCKTE